MSAGPDAGERDGEAGKRWRQAPDLRCALPGRPFSPKDLLNKATSNVIASLIFGCRFEYNDPRFLKMLNLVEDSLDEVAQFMREVGEGDEEPLLSELVKAGHLPAMGLARGFIWRVVGERAFQARDATAKRRKGLEVCVWGGEIAGNRGGRARPGSVLQERAEEPVLPLWEPQNTREVEFRFILLAALAKRGQRPALREEPGQWWRRPEGSWDLDWSRRTPGRKNNSEGPASGLHRC